jgi:hypothetical protein
MCASCLEYQSGLDESHVVKMLTNILDTQNG